MQTIINLVISPPLLYLCDIIIPVVVTFYILSITIWSLLTVGCKLKSPFQHKWINTIKFGIELLLVNMTIVITSPVLCFVLIILILTRLVLNIYLKLIYSNSIELISGQDAFWATDVINHTNYIYSLSICEGECNVEHFRERLNRKFQLDQLLGSNIYHRMKCKIVKRFGFFCYQRDKVFNVNNHVNYFNTLDPIEPISKDEILKELIKRYDSPMNESHPKWEILLIPHLKMEDSTKNHFAFISKYNHGYLDGICMVTTFNWFLADFPVKLTLNPFKKPDTNLLTTVLMNLKLILYGPHSILKGLLFKEKHNLHGPLLTGPKALCLSKPINLNTLKIIKKALEEKRCSITSILVATLVISLRRIGEEMGILVPNEINALVTSAVFPYYGLKPCNRFTMAGMTLELNNDKDIFKSIDSVVQSLENLSHSMDFLANYHAIKIIGLLPSRVIELFAHSNKSSTLIFSNVPGPLDQFTINGGLMKELACFNVIVGHTGLGVCICSAGGFVTPAFIGDAAIFPDEFIQRLAKRYEIEIEALSETLGIDINSK